MDCFYYKNKSLTTLANMMLLIFVLLGLISHGSCQLRIGQKDRERGTFLGHFETLEHDVGGAVWALDEEWLRVEGFTYDGRGPDAFFWVGTEGDQPSPQGFLVPFPSNGSGSREMVLPAFRGSDVLFRLPDKLKVSDLRWISVWCRRFTVNFGSLRVPSGVELPTKRKISELSRLAHGVRSGNVTLLDAKTLYIPNLHYDGSAPDAFFWVGKGKPDRTGHKIPNEKQSTAVLGHYDGVDIELVLPDNLTLYDIDYLSIWCVTYRHNFGHVMIPPPSELYLPPALGQTQEGSELQPVESDPRNQYDVVNQVPDTASTEAATDHPTTETSDGAVTETSDGAERVNSETDRKSMKTETKISDAETVTKASGVDTHTEADKPETVTEIVIEDSEVKVTKTETETTQSESVTFTDEKSSGKKITGSESKTSADDLPTDPNLNITEVDQNIAFLSNYSEIPFEDLSSSGNPNLTTNEYTFKYDQNPDEQPSLSNDSSQITEVRFHDEKNGYTLAVGDDESIQPVADSNNIGKHFETHGLVKIDIPRHTGAYFFAKPNSTTDKKTDEPHSSNVHHNLTEGSPQKVVEDPITPYHPHPKDISTVKVTNSPSDNETDKRAPMNDSNNDSAHMLRTKDSLHSKSSSERVSVPGGIYASLLAVIGLSILMWKM